MKSSSKAAFGHYCVFVLKLMHYVISEDLSGHFNHGTTQRSLQLFAHILLNIYLEMISTAAVFQFTETAAQNLLGSANTDRRLGLLNHASYLSFLCSTKLFYPTQPLRPPSCCTTSREVECGHLCPSLLEAPAENCLAEAQRD